VCERGNLWLAYERVIRSQGAPGEVCPTNMLCLPAFPTPHDRMLRDG
jgi:hypothetical protein